jgi:hypothetical protein
MLLRRTSFLAAMMVFAGVVTFHKTPTELYTDARTKEKKINIVMFSTPSIVSEYAGKAAAINEKYASQHGYGFQHHIQHIPATDRHAMVWKMVEVLRQSLNNTDAVMYIDSDAVFNDHSKSLDWLFGVPGEIIGCSDSPNGQSFINTGTLFVKNTKRARMLLEQWWFMREDPKYTIFPYEQMALSDLAREYPEDIIARPATEFNSVWQELRQGRRDTFVLHFMAHTSAERSAAFDTVLRTL